MCSIYYECVSAARYNVPIINIKEYRMSSNFINYLCVMWKLATSAFNVKTNQHPSKITLYEVPI